MLFQILEQVPVHVYFQMSIFGIFSFLISGVGLILLVFFALPLNTRIFSTFSFYFLKFYSPTFLFFVGISILFFIQSIVTIVHETRRKDSEDLSETAILTIQSNLYFSQRNFFITLIGFFLNIVTFILLFEIYSISKTNKSIQTKIHNLKLTQEKEDSQQIEHD